MFLEFVQRAATEILTKWPTGGMFFQVGIAIFIVFLIPATIFGVGYWLFDLFFGNMNPHFNWMFFIFLFVLIYGMFFLMLAGLGGM